MNQHRPFIGWRSCLVVLLILISVPPIISSYVLASEKAPYLPTYAPIVIAENTSSNVKNSISAPQNQKLLSDIDKALSMNQLQPSYLYETTTVKGAIAHTWTDMTASILGTKDQRVAYDNFYFSSIEYFGMRTVSLYRAKRAVKSDDPELGRRLLEDALRYEKLANLNNEAAIQTYNGSIDTAAILAKGIYEGSKAAAIYGSSMVMGPTASRVVDTVFDITDFAVEMSDNGFSSAARNLVADKLTEMIFSQATIAALGGGTLQDTIDRGVTKTLGNPEVYKIIREVVSKPEFAKAFMSFMAKSGSHVVSGLAEDQVNKIVAAILERGAGGFASELVLSKMEPSECKDANPYAELSYLIYQCSGPKCNNVSLPEPWVVIDESRADFPMTVSRSKSSMAGSTPPVIDSKQLPPCNGSGLIATACNEQELVTIQDPIGFHAVAYRNRDTGNIAIVYEGTTSINDWLANFSQVIQVPVQYKEAIKFAETIFRGECRGEKACIDNVLVAGHSLGGGLAQYVALKYGLKSYVFNPAGIWGPTANTIDSSTAAHADITIFIGKGYKAIGSESLDIVSRLGVQFSSKAIEVPMDIEVSMDSYAIANPIVYAGTKLAGYLSAHSMENMKNWMAVMCDQSVASDSSNTDGGKGDIAVALIIDRSGSMGDFTTGPAGTVDLNNKKKKLDSAKEAAKSFILWRNDNDQLSLSTFSNAGSTELSLAAAGSVKRLVDEILGKIVADGGTNIGAGLEQGYAQLDKAGSAAIKGAILLSDGLGGAWQPTVGKYIEKGWSICTLGFGADADEKTLRSIAESTGCVYEYADTVNVINKYQALGTYVEGKSTLLSANDVVAPQGKTSYPFYVSTPATMLDVFTSWLGSKLEIKLIAPDGSIIDKRLVSQGQGRYEEGDTFQMLGIPTPAPGKWSIELSWAESPQEAEQVNLLIAEKSDVFVRMHGFRPQYSIGEAVTINVDADEMLGTRKVPLEKASVSIKVQKPGPELIRLVQAQSSNWTMYKDVVLDVTRDVMLSDDGTHDDYKPGDGIFGGTFTETDKNGAYLVTATVKGKKRNGESVEKILISTFQVGPITDNQITTSQTMQYMEQAKPHINDATPYSNETIQQPLQQIDELQSDPLDSIDQLMK